jgi:hypothetical protein
MDAMHTKKHLSFSALRKKLSECFELISENRELGKVTYDMHDAMMSAFACMYFQDCSLLQFQTKMKDAKNRSNLQTIFGVKNIPKNGQLRNIIDEVDSSELNPFFKEYFKQIQRSKYLSDYHVLENMVLLSTDGTGYFSSDSIKCNLCLTAEHTKKDGDEEEKKITYAHKALQVAIVHPDKKQVIPLMPEEIKNTDGKTKQDCEINAAKRLLPRLRSDHPQLKVIMVADDLYSRQPMIEAVLKNHMHYIFVCKSTSHEYLADWISAYKSLPRKEYHGAKEERYVVEWMNNVPLHGGEKAIYVNYFRCEVFKKDKKTGKEYKSYSGSWVTDIQVDEKNAHGMTRYARCKWKIENECFNTLKNQGYYIEHNYGHGEKNLCFNFYLLTLIAFAFHQIFELTDKLYQSCRVKFGSKRHMWETLRSYIRILIFETWEALLHFSLYPDRYNAIFATPPPSV